MSVLPEEGLRLVREHGSADRWLAVLVTLRPDGQPSVSVVNATMLRALPPKGGGAETPGSVANRGRTKFKAASCISPTVRVPLEKTRFPTGTLPASKRMMNGGTVPGGMNARARLT